MEAKELMIGDWVYAIDANGEKHPCRANNLEYDYTNKRGDFCVDFYGTGYDAEWPDIAFNVEPIPLTPEILEKNGFVQKLKKYYTISIDTSLVIKREPIYGANGNTFLLGYFVNRSGFQWFIELSYVHELQHALRLCGIDKEINV